MKVSCVHSAWPQALTYLTCPNLSSHLLYLMFRRMAVSLTGEWLVGKACSMSRFHPCGWRQGYHSQGTGILVSYLWSMTTRIVKHKDSSINVWLLFPLLLHCFLTRTLRTTVFVTFLSMWPFSHHTGSHHLASGNGTGWRGLYTKMQVDRSVKQTDSGNKEQGKAKGKGASG